MVIAGIVQFSCNQDDVFTELDEQENSMIEINVTPIKSEIKLTDNYFIKTEQSTKVRSSNYHKSLELGKSEVMIEELDIMH